MPSADFLRASYPLFENEIVDVLEWSFDIGWGEYPVDEWTTELIDHYSDNHRLLGHGVTFSLLSGRWDNAHEIYLSRLKQECIERNYIQVSEHFGYSRAANFAENTIFPVPLTPSTLAIGKERLELLCEATKGLPIGLENLAFAFCENDVQEQGKFLTALLDGQHFDNRFLLLDLHNIWCQMMNFNRTFDELIAQYPIDQVREVHISGGSWVDKVRRDTHDGDVPEQLFALLEMALRKCRNVHSVILERLADTMGSTKDEEQFRADYARMRRVVRSLTYA